MRGRLDVLVALILASPRPTLSFSPSVFAVATDFASQPGSGKTTKTTTAGSSSSPQPTALGTNDVVTCVAVAGATGRTGRLVVEELLDRNVSRVVAIVRNMDKADEVFGGFPIGSSDRLEIVQCDLGDATQIASLLVENKVDAAIWCATGFSDAPGTSPIEKFKRLLGIALAPKRSIDAVGLPALGETLAGRTLSSSQRVNGDGDKDFPPPVPKVVMCSSAGVTRPVWEDVKKEKLVGAADIPIVRLNPFGILDVKRESEERLRESGVEYCIVRPAGLNDEKMPAGSRPVFSQGDVAVGRTNRRDVAAVLVDVLSTPEATGKTFEMVGLAGYPKPVSIGPALARLARDDEGPLSDEIVTATYAALQQLLPGEKQDAAALAMGQTYEQLDKDQVGRLGRRGEEDAEAVAPKPSSSS